VSTRHLTPTSRPALCSSLTFLFSFHCYGDHRDLHSFPTRRSSDLAARGEQRRGADRPTLRVRPGAPRGVPLRGLAGRGIPREEQDRKSTRLNSSHEAISYAVFCLKKKKTDISLTDHFHTRNCDSV